MVLMCFIDSTEFAPGETIPGGCFGGGKNFFVTLHLVLANGRAADLALGAIAAVLRTQSVLNVVENMNRNRATEVALARLEGGMQKRKQVDVFAVENPKRTLGTGRLVGQGLFGEFAVFAVGVGHGRPRG